MRAGLPFDLTMPFLGIWLLFSALPRLSPHYQQSREIYVAWLGSELFQPWLRRRAIRLNLLFFSPCRPGTGGGLGGREIKHRRERAEVRASAPGWGVPGSPGSCIQVF